jgi:hypothetical protein
LRTSGLATRPLLLAAHAHAASEPYLTRPFAVAALAALQAHSLQARPAPSLAHQLQLSFSTTEPGLISGRTPQCSDVVALLRSPKPAQ